MFKPPKIEKLLDAELYQARREVIGQQEKVHRLRVVLAQAEAALHHYEKRELFLAAQISRSTPPPPIEYPKLHEAEKLMMSRGVKA